jgi:hypothetical protein
MAARLSVAQPEALRRLKRGLAWSLPLQVPGQIRAVSLGYRIGVNVRVPSTAVKLADVSWEQLPCRELILSAPKSAFKLPFSPVN